MCKQTNRLFPLPAVSFCDDLWVSDLVLMQPDEGTPWLPMAARRGSCINTLKG